MRKRSTCRKKSQRGMVLVTLAVVVIAIVGLLGLSLDLGRVYIAKSELQNYADASAFSGRDAAKRHSIRH